MRPGRKPTPRAAKAAQGTLRRDRDVYTAVEAAPGDVIPPEGSMTDEGMLVWELLAPQAIAIGMLRPCDAEQFAAFCNLSAFVRQCHRSGEPAPAAHYAEQRRQAELFGLAGARSRQVTGGNKPGQPNPFLRNGAPLARRSGSA